MPEEEKVTTPQPVVLEATRVTDAETFWMRHRLSLLLIITVLVACTLTVVSMVI